MTMSKLRALGTRGYARGRYSSNMGAVRGKTNSGRGRRLCYKRDYVIETDLTSEEIQWCEEAEREYKEHPESFITLEELLKKYGIRR